MRRVLRDRSKASSRGFTLLEILVVVIIIGVLAAIMAASWTAAMNRQRVNAVRDQVNRVIQQAQTDAKRTGIARVVVFGGRDGTSLEAAITVPTLNPNTGRTGGFITDFNSVTGWQSLGSQEVSTRNVEFAILPGAERQLIFESNGTISKASMARAVSENVIFGFNVRPKGSNVNANRCVIVGTLLGATRTADGTNCPT